MNKAHSAINWENYPSDETPLNESNLNKMDAAIGVIDDRVITLDTTKATKTEVATLVADVTFEESTGIITITKKNGSKVMIDTQMEKIAINFDYNPTTQQIILTLIDGTKQYIDLSALITQYEFLDSDTVTFYIDKDGKVSAIVKEGSIEEKHLEPNYLAKIKVEVAKAESSQQAAAMSEINAKASENAAKASETAAKNQRTMPRRPRQRQRSQLRRQRHPKATQKSVRHPPVNHPPQPRRKHHPPVSQLIQQPKKQILQLKRQQRSSVKPNLQQIVQPKHRVMLLVVQEAERARILTMPSITISRQKTYQKDLKVDCSHTEQLHLQIFRHLRMLAQGGCLIFQTNLRPPQILKREPGIQFRPERTSIRRQMASGMCWPELQLPESKV